MSEPQETTSVGGQRANSPPEDDAEIIALKAERKKINARIRAKRTGNKTEARKLRERRAMLTGLAVMDALERDASPAERALIHRWRDTWLKRPQERAVFNLPPLLVVDNPPAAVTREMREAELA